MYVYRNYYNFSLQRIRMNTKNINFYDKKIKTDEF